MDAEDLTRCAENIARNIKTPFRASSLLRSRDPAAASIATMFIDINVGSSICFDDFEVTSCKTYRQLHCLVKMRVIDAVLDQRELADDLLRKLGYKKKG